MILRSIAIAALLCSIAAADAPWIKQDDYDSLHLVVRDGADAAESTAARRFRMRWTTLAGFEPTLSNDARPGAVHVWIGGAARAAFPAIVASYSLSQDGFAIRTHIDSLGRHLLLFGGGDRGMLYAEWEFFERCMGAKAIGPLGIVWPDPPPAEILPIDFRCEPPFEYRDTNFSAYLEQDWLANANRLNGQWTALPDAQGGHIGFVHDLEGYGHTFHDFVNPDEYFDAHPEYFAEIDGKRVKWSQLCLSNEDVLAITIRRAREFLSSAAPDERILSVSQEDYPEFRSWCTCPRCYAVDREEGSHSGTVIRFVNAVAEAVETEYPDALIDTFAYMHTRRPPKVARLRDNVLVRVCGFEADYGRPLRDRRSQANRAFLRDLKEWRRIGQHVWVWEYSQNGWAFAAPHPNERVFQPNLETYRRVGLDGVFVQASPYSSNSDLEALKAYLVGRGLRDPGFDDDRAYAEFLATYFGPAADYIDEYRLLLRDRLRESGSELRFYNRLKWLDAKTVEQAQDIFARAFARVRDEPFQARLQEAYVSVQLAALVCPARVHQLPASYVFTRPRSQTLDEFIQMLSSRDILYLNDYPLDNLRVQLPHGTPARHEVAQIERLINDRSEVWIVPAIAGSVVRWREHVSGRDWLRGYDEILSGAGRFQDWAETGAYPMAEPRPVDEPYTVTHRSDDSITLTAVLANGLRVTRVMTLTAEGLEVSIELQNESQNMIEPKFGHAGDYSERGLSRPVLRAKSGERWTTAAWHAEDKSGWNYRSASGESAWALRYPQIRRSVMVETLSGDIDSTSIARGARHGSATVLTTLDRSPLAPGERRSVTLRYSITTSAPGRAD